MSLLSKLLGSPIEYFKHFTCYFIIQIHDFSKFYSFILLSKIDSIPKNSMSQNKLFGNDI